MDAAFQLICDNKGARLKLTPATDGGAPIDIGTLVDYLNFSKVDFLVPEISKAATDLTEETVIELTDKATAVVAEQLALQLTEDNMSCVGRFMPPSEGGSLNEYDDIVAAMKRIGVVYGIKEDAIEGFLKDRRYFTDIVLAEGKEPEQGRDAEIEYFFNTDLKARPTLKEDGSVDFFNLNIINHVTEGELLARLTREVPGKYGQSVLGEKTKPRDVRKKVLRFGRNIRLSEDKNEIFSTCDGHVTLVDGRVFVSNVMQVENVDPATGNIEYEGNVQVNGNVATNFSVKARGNVEVRGVVEGAEIEAGGNITIARGMNGMSRGVLKAGGNVIAQFIENSTVEAAGYVEAGSIMHSQIFAGTEVHVGGKRGFISGGKVAATTLVEAKILGSDMGTDTIVEIGISPTIKRRHKELEELIDTNNKTIGRAIPILEAARDKFTSGVEMSPEQIDNIKGLAAIVREKKKEQHNNYAELEEIKALLADEKKASVVVKDTVYPGVKVAISDVSKIIKEPVKYCRFVKERGDVKMVGMN